ncbi:MAG TPA: hypothetical protein VES60_03180, partial [Nakamurella sp.]|nr:hypothetical protein [Nakamurella sp.]
MSGNTGTAVARVWPTEALAWSSEVRMAGQSKDNALDHVVVVVFENRSLDNLLGRLYGPEDGKT